MVKILSFRFTALVLRLLLQRLNLVVGNFCVASDQPESESSQSERQCHDTESFVKWQFGREEEDETAGQRLVEFARGEDVRPAFGNYQSADDSTDCRQAGVDTAEHKGDNQNGPDSRILRVL